MIGAAWALLVLIVLIWQFVTYRGIVEQLVEWQFTLIDFSFPVATILLLTLLLASPFLVVLFLRLREARRHSNTETPASAISRGAIMQWFLAVITGLFAAAAVVTAAFALTFGSLQERALPVSWTNFDRGEVSEGPARLAGTLRLDRIAYFEDRFFVSGRTLWVAPLTRLGSPERLRVFAEIDQRLPEPARRAELTGVLRQESVPGELRQLYESAGYAVSEDAYLLFEDMDSARAPFWSATLDYAIASLVFLLFFAFNRQRLHRLRHARKRAEADDGIT